MIPFEEVRQAALACGWDDVGITQAKIPEADIQAYLKWLADGSHAEMAYMENTIRCNPASLFPNAQNAIIFVTYYKQEKHPFRHDAGIIASYARGRDYHHLHRKRLKKFIAWLEKRSDQKEIAKGFSDSFPILEKALAVQAGLGWFGKNTLLIHRKYGTFILLSGLLTSLDIEHPEKTSLRLPKCGQCNRCLDACPTQALVSPYYLDAKRCLSFHTIESKQEIPHEIAKKNPGYIFGCDICQDVCPHNARTPLSHLAEFSSGGQGAYLDSDQIVTLEENPEKLFGTPLQRKGAKGLKENFRKLNKLPIIK